MFCSLKVKQCVDFLHASRHSEELLTLPPYAPICYETTRAFFYRFGHLKNRSFTILAKMHSGA